MTTEALLETVVNYPLLANMYAFDSIQMGVRSVASYFPALDILFARKDLPASIEKMRSEISQTMPEETDEGILLRCYLDTIEQLAAASGK